MQDNQQKEYNKSIDSIDQLIYALGIEFDEITRTEKECCIYQDKRKTDNIKHSQTQQHNKEQLRNRLNKDQAKFHRKIQQATIDMEQKHPQLNARWKKQSRVDINRQDWDKIHQQHHLQDIIQQQEKLRRQRWVQEVKRSWKAEDKEQNQKRLILIIHQEQHQKQELQRERQRDRRARRQAESIFKPADQFKFKYASSYNYHRYNDNDKYMPGEDHDWH